jgi:HSP20 family protein
MSLVRWNPFAEFDSMFNRRMPAAFINWPRLPVENGNAVWAPSADISETEKEFCIRAELPAVKKEDVKVTLEDGMITVKGERRQEKEVKEAKFHQVETVYGSFERRFGLPENVNPEGVRCDYKDGILSIHLPKTEAKKATPKHISVQ